LESDAPHSLVALARAGIGAAILSGSVRTPVPTAPLHAKTGPLRLKFAAIWDPRRVLPRPALNFIDAFEGYFRETEGR
jgi:DNA-binding transcriptional LysR family regulator